MGRLSEESFEADIEEMVMKIRWNLMSEDKNNTRKKSSSDVAFDVIIDELYTEDEKRQLKEEEDIAEAKSRMIFDSEERVMDLSKRRVTDLKMNSRVNFPRGQNNFEMEAKFETIRTEAMGLFEDYVSRHCSKGGQVSKL